MVDVQEDEEGSDENRRKVRRSTRLNGETSEATDVANNLASKRQHFATQNASHDPLSDALNVGGVERVKSSVGGTKKASRASTKSPAKSPSKPLVESPEKSPAKLPPKSPAKQRYPSRHRGHTSSASADTEEKGKNEIKTETATAPSSGQKYVLSICIQFFSLCDI